MRRSVIATLPIIAAACLLGGSASAECPQFNSPLPTVFVTDVTDTGAPDITANFFVYTDAFDLVDYVDFGSTGLTDARWAFNEFQTGSSTPETGSNRIYAINGQQGAASVPTTAAAVDSASSGGSGGSVATGGLLTFRNVKLSPTSSTSFPAPLPADVTPPGNTRTITMYLISPSTSSACFLNANIDVASFQVITEVGSPTNPDRLTGASCSFTPFQSYPTFDNAWNYGELDPAFSPTPASLDAPTIAGYSGSAPAGTTTIGFASTAALNATFATWRRNLGTPLAADTLYRVRSTVNTNGTVNQTNWFRIRFGGDFFSGHGYGEQGYASRASSAPINSAKTMTLYHWAKSASAGDGLPGGPDQPAFQMDLIDEDATQGGHNFTVANVVIDSTTRDCLGTGVVLRNRGAATLTSDDGYAPPSGATAFNSTDYINGNFPDVGSTASMTVSFTSPIAGAANFTFASALATNNTGFAAFTGSTAEAAVTVSNSKVYAFDVWVSAAVAPNTTSSRPPVLRLRWIADQSVGANHGQINSPQWNLHNDNDFNGVSDDANGISAANSAKHYASFWQPDLVLSAQPITTSNYFVDFIYNRQGGSAIKPNGTFTVERLVITEYDQPTF